MTILSFLGNINSLTEKDKEELSNLPYINLINIEEITFHNKGRIIGFLGGQLKS